MEDKNIYNWQGNAYWCDITRRLLNAASPSGKNVRYDFSRCEWYQDSSHFQASFSAMLQNKYLVVDFNDKGDLSIFPLHRGGDLPP